MPRPTDCRRSPFLTITAVAPLLLLPACKPAEDSVYTLYSGHASGPRIYVATFDSADGADHNKDTCETARLLFQAKPGVVVEYWCEKGRYTK
jgi:hypothetical protein